MSDVIVALATGAGRAGVAIVRISGDGAGDILEALIAAPRPIPRYAKTAVFRGVSGEAIDSGLALWFPGPASFTGEDVAELHCHGGPAVIAALIEACLAFPAARLAEPGEFTRRAYENGKLDLAEVEGLADLIESETEGQRAQALRQMQGALSALYDGWRDRLIEAMVLLEADIDFPDEGLPADLVIKTEPLIDALAADIEAHLADHRGERVRDGYRIAIIGPPNAGKSSLLNALAGREAAIVSDIPGTTRDVVEIRLVLAGFPVWIADTAGLREAADSIEAEGVRRALQRAEEADLRVGLVEFGQTMDPALAGALRPGDLLIQSKFDLAGPQVGPSVLPGMTDGLTRSDPVLPGYDQTKLSIRTGEGMAELERLLAARVTAALGPTEAPALTRLRHRRLLEAALVSLRRAVPALNAGAELAAEDLRNAGQSLGKLTGKIDVEDLLDEVFAGFCIGK